MELRFRETRSARPENRWAADHVFEMVDRQTGQTAGFIKLRLADTEELVFYGGQIGYGVDEPFRGRHFAARAVRLLLPVAKAIGMNTVWITCDPSNIASYRSLEIAGGEYVETRDVPPTSPMYDHGRRLTCRFRFDL